MNDYAAAHDRFHAAGFDPEEGLIRVHHEITQHLGKCECDWSGLVVEMSRERLDLMRKYEHLPMGVVAAIRQAQDAGATVGDLVTLLTAEGWEIRLVPAGTDAGDMLPVNKIIREVEGEYCVFSEDGTRSFGCYGTVEEAQARLAQIHSFGDDEAEYEGAAPESIREGIFVSWNSSGGRARGRVEHVMTEGTLGVPGSSFSINASPEDPAVLIRIWRPRADGWAETPTLVGHRASTLTVIGDLEKATKREDGEDFPPEAFAYTPDLERPSTWKLRLWDSLEERETRAQVSRAVQALSPSGFRGNRVDIPAEDVAGVKARVREAWDRVNPDREAPAILKQESFEPPLGVQEAAQRAVRWIEDGRAGDGFTAVGRARAAQLARGAAVSMETVGRMRSYFARHEFDQQAEGWNAGEAGFPTPGRVAWDAWGGDAGREWSNMIWDRASKRSIPSAVTDLHLNLENRQHAIEEYLYGPMNPAEPGDYWERLGSVWGVSGGEAQSTRCGNCAAFNRTPEMLEAISAGIGDAGDETVEAAGLGYCELFQFKCAAARSCSAWLSGGPIVEESDPVEPEEVLELGKAAGDVRKAEEQRFTLGPWYIPDTVDAHGEFTDADELQQALWRYVRSGDRRIRLQHNVEVVAGEAVEMMTWPHPVTLPLGMPDGSMTERTFPENTVFLGVVWEPWAWEYVKAGRISGYSIGGTTDRVMVDMPG